MSVSSSRAFLFGLTLTELMILFVFLLALLIGAAAKKQRELEIISSAVPELERELEIATTAASHAQDTADKSQSQMQAELRIRIDLEARLENLKREVQKIRDDTGSAHELMAVLDDEDKALFQKLLTDAKDTLEKNTQAKDLIRVLQESVAEPKSRRELKVEMDHLREMLQQQSLKASTLEQAREVQRRRAEHYRKKIANGRGVDLPPCWLNDSGSTEYLFTATMTASGYRLVPAWGDHRQDEAMSIPSVRELSNSTLKSQEFLARTDPILSWSDERECRHFVRVVDEVGENKDRYKLQLQRLEQRFYKYLLN